MRKQIVRNNFVFEQDQSDQSSMLCDETIQESELQDSQTQQQQKCSHCGHRLEDSADRRHEPRCKGKKISMQPIDKRKAKKKAYKKRLHLKVKQERQHAVKILQVIIRDIYSLKTHFDNQKSSINKCLDLQLDEAKFSEFINSVIREQVQMIRVKVKGQLRSIDVTNMDYTMVQQLFQQFLRVRQASPEIEKIINLFLAKSQRGESQLMEQTKLDEMTFKFILSEEESKEKLGMFFQAVRSTKDPHLYRERAMIDNMIEMLREVDLDQEDEIFEEEDDSTTHSSEDYQEQCEKQGSSRKKRNKKKKKTQGLDFSYEAVLERLQNFELSEERTECNVIEDWLRQLERSFLQ